MGCDRGAQRCCVARAAHVRASSKRSSIGSERWLKRWLNWCRTSFGMLSAQVVSVRELFERNARKCAGARPWLPNELQKPTGENGVERCVVASSPKACCGVAQSARSAAVISCTEVQNDNC